MKGQGKERYEKEREDKGKEGDCHAVWLEPICMYG